MFEVKAEGVRFFYLAKGEDLVVEEPFTKLKLPSVVALELAANANDVRLAIFESPLERGVGYVRFLFWPPNHDLADLDRRVEAGTYTDQDFVSSVKTYYQDTFCEQCGSVWPSLSIDSGDPYIGAPGLINKKIAQAKTVNCPNCEASLRQLIVRIFEARK